MVQASEVTALQTITKSECSKSAGLRPKYHAQETSLIFKLVGRQDIPTWQPFERQSYSPPRFMSHPSDRGEWQTSMALRFGTPRSGRRMLSLSVHCQLPR